MLDASRLAERAVSAPTPQEQAARLAELHAAATAALRGDAGDTVALLRAAGLRLRRGSSAGEDSEGGTARGAETALSDSSSSDGEFQGDPSGQGPETSDRGSIGGADDGAYAKLDALHAGVAVSAPPFEPPWQSKGPGQSPRLRSIRPLAASTGRHAADGAAKAAAAAATSVALAAASVLGSEVAPSLARGGGGVAARQYSLASTAEGEEGGDHLDGDEAIPGRLGPSAATQASSPFRFKLGWHSNTSRAGATPHATVTAISSATVA